MVVKLQYMKNDMRQITRDPIMTLLMISPALIIVLFKSLIEVGEPYLTKYTELTINNYYIYILVFVILVIPGLLGVVTGFMMLDDKDVKIVELMSVTPLGKTGYLINRLMFCSGLTIIFSLIAYYTLGIYYIPFYTLICIVILLGVYSIILGAVLFGSAEDKVKGLTYAKGLNLIQLFAFSKLLDEKWFSIFSMFFPTYWIMKLMQNPMEISIYIMAITVHLVWGIIVVRQSIINKLV